MAHVFSGCYVNLASLKGTGEGRVSIGIPTSHYIFSFSIFFFSVSHCYTLNLGDTL